MDSVIVFLGGYLNHVLVAIVWFVAVVLAIVYRRRHPKVSLMTIIAVTVLFVDSVATTFLSTSLPLMVDLRGVSMASAARVMGAVFIVTAVVRAAAWILLVIAIFGWRRSAEQQ